MTTNLDSLRTKHFTSSGLNMPEMEYVLQHACDQCALFLPSHCSDCLVVICIRDHFIVLVEVSVLFLLQVADTKHQILCDSFGQSSLFLCSKYFTIVIRISINNTKQKLKISFSHSIV